MLMTVFVVILEYWQTCHWLCVTTVDNEFTFAEIEVDHLCGLTVCVHVAVNVHSVPMSLLTSWLTFGALTWAVCRSELGSAQETFFWRSYSTKWSFWTSTNPFWRDHPANVHRIVVFPSRRCSTTCASFVTLRWPLAVFSRPRSPAGVFVPTVLVLAFTKRLFAVLRPARAFRPIRLERRWPWNRVVATCDSHSANHVSGIRQGIPPVGRIRRFLPLGLRLTSCRELHSLCHCLWVPPVQTRRVRLQRSPRSLPHAWLARQSTVAVPSTPLRNWSCFGTNSWCWCVPVPALPCFPSDGLDGSLAQQILSQDATRHGLVPRSMTAEEVARWGVPRSQLPVVRWGGSPNIATTLWPPSGYCQHGHAQTRSQFLLWRAKCVSSSDSRSTCFTGIELGSQRMQIDLFSKVIQCCRWASPCRHVGCVLRRFHLKHRTHHYQCQDRRVPSSYTSNFHRKVSVRSTTSSTDQVSLPWISMLQMSTVSD